MATMSAVSRSENIRQLESTEFDLLIIGGGITGSGAARDAAMRGMKVGLIEANDFASGTSCRSSKLIHGGIRYLENLEFHLVFEALSERTKLFEMAPHLTHHLRFMLPLYKDSRVGMFKMGLGMWLYDALALFRAPQLHERLNAKETLGRMPLVRENGLIGSYIYSDGYMDDDRLSIETLRSAAAHGATVANFTRATGVSLNSAGKITEVLCEDLVQNKKFKISAKHVISSVGPWTDELGKTLFNQWKSVMRPTKGVHLTLSRDRLPLTSAVVMAAENSSRIVFAIPRHEMIIIGTTDTDYSGDPGKVSATKEDIDYILKVTSDYFPGAKLSIKDIIASYAGVRPLVKDDSSSAGKTSREHVIWNDQHGITFVAGGKYTTYRLMAEQVIDKALEEFSSESRSAFRKVNTACALNQYTSVENYKTALSQIDELSKKYGRSKDVVQSLTQRYGAEVENILARAKPEDTYYQIEACHAIEESMCLSLIDFWSRRTHLFLAESDHGLKFVDEVVKVFVTKLGWDEDFKSFEVKKLNKYIEQELAWKMQR